MTDNMHTLESVLNCDYMIDGSKTESCTSTILRHDHVPIDVDKLSLDQYLVLVMEVLVVEIFLRNYAYLHLILILRWNYQLNNKNHLG